MFDLIRRDLNRKAEWYGLAPSPGARLRMGLGEGGTAQILYRAMQFCQKRKAGKPLAFLLYRLNAHLSHAVIGRNADFGPGLIILHTFGIVVNSSVRAGQNLTLEHGVTIGAEKDVSPILGDNVFVGAGAKILGSVCIGSDVKIGANAVVVTDLPDGATAVGVPARIVRIYGERVPAAPARRELQTTSGFEEESSQTLVPDAAFGLPLQSAPFHSGPEKSAVTKALL